MFDIEKIYGKADELPLDNLAVNGGFCRIFKNVACIGDSLSSGEFESLTSDGIVGYHDFYEYSWGQYMARTLGCKVYNFSAGGMTAKWYNESFADLKDFWSREKLAQCYIIALGVNDINAENYELGSISDINVKNFRKNAPTFAGDYARIICRYKEMQPNAKFFLVTMPRDEHGPKCAEHTKLLYEMANLFDNTYVIDLEKYGPVYDSNFREKFYVGNHMNAAGYVLTAELMMSYIDYIIRHNPKDFAQVGFIGTEYYFDGYKK